MRFSTHSRGKRRAEACSFRLGFQKGEPMKTGLIRKETVSKETHVGKRGELECNFRGAGNLCYGVQGSDRSGEGTRKCVLLHSRGSSVTGEAEPDPG